MLKRYNIQSVIEAGCDEAGRGPLAGSVFAAAVIFEAPNLTFPQKGKEVLVTSDGIRTIGEEWELINDSKQLTDKQRQRLRPWIEEHAAAWAVAEVTAEEIDHINILNASILAMQRALDKLTIRPQHILVDGNKWKPYIPQGEVMAVPATTVVKGDATYLSIAAASILAKTYRDEYMTRLSQEYPQYGWDRNMGYPTAEHYKAIQKYGVTPYHRKTFNLRC